MSVHRDINFQITGQVPDDYGSNNDYKKVKAELTLICAKYNLDIEEEY